MSKKRFKIESIGYVAHKYAKTTLFLTVIFFAFMWVGQSRIIFNSNVTDLFNNNGPEYDLFDRVNKIFSTKNDIMFLTISGEKLLTPNNIEKLNNLQLELEFHDNILSSTSPFSMRKHPDVNGQMAPLFQANITDDNVKEVLQTAYDNPLVGGKLLSKDNQLILFILDVDKPKVDKAAGQGKDNEERLAYLELRDNLVKLAKTELGDEGLEFEISGVNVFQADIIGYMLYDQKIYLIFGILFGIVISWIYFRRGKFVILAGVPTIISLVAMHGIIGWLEIEMDVLSNVAPILIMVISFCDSVHIVYGIRRRMEYGQKRDDAILETIKHIGPACVLTSLTTGIAMVSLLVAQHPIISKFGFICTFGTGFAFVITLSFIPAMARMILPETMNLRHLVTEQEDEKTKQPFIHVFIHHYTEICKKIFMTWPKQVSIFAIAAVVVLAAFYVQNEPRYEYTGNLPQTNSAYIGVSKIEEKLSGTNEIRIFVEFSKTHDLQSEVTFDFYKEVEAILSKTSFVKQTFSLATVRDYIQKNSDDKSAKQFFDFIKAQDRSVDSLLNMQEKVGLVIGLLPDVDAAALLPELKKLKIQLKQLEAKYPFAKSHVTGILPLTAQSSYSMIELLNYSLLLAVMGGVFIVGVVYRSVYAGLFTLIANLIPIGIAGFYLYIFDEGLQFTTVVAFTIGFGIAVDNTIHVVHRYNRAIKDGLDVEAALNVTMDSVVSVLVITSIVLAFGVGIVILSQMPLIKLYGAMLMMLVLTALLTDTLLLPSAMRIVHNYQNKKLASKKKKPTKV